MKSLFVSLMVLASLITAQEHGSNGDNSNSKQLPELIRNVRQLQNSMDKANAWVDTILSSDQVKLRSEQEGLKTRIGFLQDCFLSLLGIFFGGLGYAIYRERKIKIELQKEAEFIKLVEKVRYLEQQLVNGSMSPGSPRRRASKK